MTIFGNKLQIILEMPKLFGNIFSRILNIDIVLFSKQMFISVPTIVPSLRAPLLVDDDPKYYFLFMEYRFSHKFNRNFETQCRRHFK